VGSLARRKENKPILVPIFVNFLMFALHSYVTVRYLSSGHARYSLKRSETYAYRGGGFADRQIGWRRFRARAQRENGDRRHHTAADASPSQHDLVPLRHVSNLTRLVSGSLHRCCSFFVRAEEKSAARRRKRHCCSRAHKREFPKFDALAVSPPRS